MPTSTNPKRQPSAPVTSWPIAPIAPIDRLRDLAVQRLVRRNTSGQPVIDTAQARAIAIVDAKVAALRSEVRAAVEAESDRHAYAPAKAARFIDLHTDCVMDTLLVWAAALDPGRPATRVKYSRGRPRKDEHRVAPTGEKRPGRPREFKRSVASNVFDEQWRIYFPDYGRGRGARGRAVLRDKAKQAFAVLVGILNADLRNLRR